MSEGRVNSLWKILVLTGALAAFLVALTCFYQLRETEAAVLTTFEKPVATVTAAGLHLKWPWPVQKVYPFDLRTRLYQSPYMEFLVRDGFNIVVRVFTCWSIDNVGVYKNKVGVTMARGESLMATVVGKYLKIVLSEHALADFVGVGNTGADGGFAAIEDQVLELIAQEADQEYGIRVRALGIDRLELPEDTTEVVFERMKSERMKMVEKIIGDGKYKAATIRKDADMDRNRVLAEAEAEAARLRGEAETKVFEFLEVYKQNPDFALYLEKLQTLENTMKTKTTIVIDDNVPPFDMLSADPHKRQPPAPLHKD